MITINNPSMEELQSVIEGLVMEGASMEDVAKGISAGLCLALEQDALQVLALATVELEVHNDCGKG